MLFATTSLAARIEAAECGLLGGSAEAAARRRPEGGVFRMPLAGGVATFTAQGSPLNKVAGLGFAGPLSESEIETVEAAFKQRGSPVRVEVASLGDPAIVRMLTARGYTLEAFENVLGRKLEPEGTHAMPGHGVEVTSSPPEELRLWLDLVVTAFASPDSQGVPSNESYPRDLLEGVMADMVSAPGFTRFLARRDGAPAGGASLRLGEGVAQLCGASTLPEHRRRGVQSALLQARLQAAAAAGCDVAVVTTEPGSKSQENVQRLGFDLLYTRAILVRSFGGRS
jgi:GNAT superfamily N-acetyltransferase